MKKFLIIILALAWFHPANAQDPEAMNLPVDGISGLITYQEVVEEEGNKDVLFNRCSEWLHTFYANPWEATKIRDQATGLIKIQHQFRIYDLDEAGNKKEAGMVLYTARIEFKENRYRFTVDNFILKQVSKYPIENWLDKSRPDYSEKWLDYLHQINDFVTVEWIPSLKEKMKPPVEVKEEEW